MSLSAVRPDQMCTMICVCGFGVALWSGFLPDSLAADGHVVLLLCYMYVCVSMYVDSYAMYSYRATKKLPSFASVL